MAIKFGNKGGGAAAAAPAKSKPPIGKAAVQQEAGAGASLLPEDWVSGGLLNDVDVTITDMTWVDDWTYNGKVEQPVLALRVTFLDDDKTETIQHFSAGDLSRFVPSEDGKRADRAPGSTASQLNNNTNCAAFIASIIDAGFPKKMVSDRVDVFEGMNVHVNRVPQQKRSGLVSLDDKQRDVLVVTKINALPGETVKTAGKGVAKVNGRAGLAKPVAAATPAETEAPAGDDAAMEAAAEVVAAVLEEKGGSIAAKSLSLAALKHLSGNPHRAAIIALLKNEEFLGADGVPWSFDGTTVSAG